MVYMQNSENGNGRYSVVYLDLKEAKSKQKPEWEKNFQRGKSQALSTWLFLQVLSEFQIGSYSHVGAGKVYGEVIGVFSVELHTAEPVTSLCTENYGQSQETSGFTV